MRKFIKKSIAVTSALAMALSIAPLAGAADGETDIENAKGNVTVTDQFEGYVDKKVFNVVLPTVSSITFTLDPQGLLNIADSGKYTQKTGAVYFSNTGDSYTDTSDAIEVTNQSSYGVNANIKLTVTNTETSGITVVDSADALADATTPSIYLGLKKDDGDAAALKAGETTDTKKLAAVAEDQEGGATGTGYYIDATASGDSPLGKKTYAYKLGTGFTASADQKASFKLTGKCDSTSDWSKVSSATMNNFTVAVAWDITEATADDYKITVAADGSASYTFASKPSTDSTGITALSADDTDRLAAVSAGNVSYDDNAGKITFKTPAVTNFLAGASSVKATINGEEFTFTVVDHYAIKISNGTASLTFDSASKPSGTITALKINGTDDRIAAVTAGNVTYNEGTGVLEFKAPAVTNFLSSANTVDITIGSASYLLRVSK